MENLLIPATWWLGLKTTIETWDEAPDALRKAFGKKKPSYQLYIDLFSLIHEDQSNTDVFVCRARAIFADIPDKLDEKVQLDMVYRLLNRRIRKRIPRDDITTFSDLLDKARAVEQTLAEVSKRKEEKLPKEDKVYSKKPRCYPKCNKLPKTTNVKSTSVSESVEFNIEQQRITAERPLLQIEINNRKGIDMADSGAQISIAGRKLHELLQQDGCVFEKDTIELAYADGILKTGEIERTEVPVKIADKLLASSCQERS
ncbi:Arc2 [Carabus blaptoides fortunei]